jgi:hypothetical protein
VLSQFRTIVLDEFHERSTRISDCPGQAGLARRDDLRSQTSATLDSAAVSAFSTIARSSMFRDVHIRSTSATQPDSPLPMPSPALRRRHGRHPVFRPGAFEIRRAIDEISARGGNQSADPWRSRIVDAGEQDAVLRPSKSPRRIVWRPTSPRRR